MGNNWVRQAIPGLYTVGQPLLADSRGSFHKILTEQPASGGQFNVDEIYWSSSNVGVARGMHLQVPPFEGRKLVFATLGAVRDIVIDLRVGSPTHHKTWEAELFPDGPGVLIPPGCAHGFVVQDGPAILVYAQEGLYSKKHDTGVNMDSIGLPGLNQGHIKSERDEQLPSLTEFDSPFQFDESQFPDWNAES